jgi:hypothetical protein
MRAAVQAVSDPDAGPVRVADLDALVRDVVFGAEAYDLTRTAVALRGRPVLLVGATDDREAPLALHHAPLVEAFAAAGAERLTHALLAADTRSPTPAPALHGLLVEWVAGTLCHDPPHAG